MSRPRRVSNMPIIPAAGGLAPAANWSGGMISAGGPSLRPASVWALAGTRGGAAPGSRHSGGGGWGAGARGGPTPAGGGGVWARRGRSPRFGGVGGGGGAGGGVPLVGVLPKAPLRRPPGGPPLPSPRRYQPTHTIGHFRYLECSQ